jgi:hypothetical protein
MARRFPRPGAPTRYRAATSVYVYSRENEDEARPTKVLTKEGGGPYVNVARLPQSARQDGLKGRHRQAL